MALHILISGKVQGVFFRAFVEDKATHKHLKGFVRNLSNGTVEIHAEGNKKKLGELIEVCKKGPLAAHVETMDVKEVPDENYEDFEIL